MRKMEFWKLKIKLGNQSFEELFENGILGKLNFEDWNLRKLFWEWKFRKLKKLKSWKFIMRMGFRKIKFWKSWNLKKLFW